MIGRLREALIAAGHSPTPEELADILWLATLCPEELPEPDDADVLGGRPAGGIRLPGSAGTAPRRPAGDPAPGRRTAVLYPTGNWDLGAGSSVAHITIPVPAPLPNAADLVRALRPLRAFVASRTEVELDIAATVDEMAQRTRQIVLRPAWELLLDATLVVDDGESMAVWQGTATRLFQVLHRLRAFKRLRMVGMNTDWAHTVPLTAEPFRTGAPAVKVSPGGRHLILVLSDGVGEAWHSGAARHRLAGWAAKGPLAVLHVLPEHMWPDTGLPGARMLVTATRPAAPGRQLVARHARLPLTRSGSPGLPVPVLDLMSAGSVDAWAGLVSAPSGDTPLPIVDAGPVPLPGELFVPPADAGATDEPDPDPEDALRDFLGLASPEARLLAAHLACVAPLTIPLMRLVQYSVVQHTHPAHLAEVFLAGLMVPHVEPMGEQADPGVPVVHSEQPWDRRLYGFPASVISPLRELIKRSDERATHELVTEYLARHQSAEAAGMALLADPQGVLHSTPDAPELAKVEVSAPDPGRLPVAARNEPAVPQRSAVHQTPEPLPTPENISAPYFYLSYAARNTAELGGSEDPSVVEFFRDVSNHIRQLTAIEPYVDAGYLDRSLSFGPHMPARRREALATCQTFVALLTPAYFRSADCGREWAAFEARQALSRPSGSVIGDAIIPVLWVDERLVSRNLPGPVERRLATTSMLPDLAPYRADGVYGLRNSGNTRDYRRTTLAIARKIVEVALSTRIPPCSPDVFDEGANAFAGDRTDS